LPINGNNRVWTKLEAIKFAAAARFRPILMTSLSTILGVLPLTLGFGEGAQSRVAMGVAVVGGLIISTFLTFMLYQLFIHIFQVIKRL
jgi:multidrug efflux pump